VRVAFLAGLICVTAAMGQPSPRPPQPGEIPFPSGQPQFQPGPPPFGPGQPPIGPGTIPPPGYYSDPSHTPIGSPSLPDLRNLLGKKTTPLIDPKLLELLTKNQKLKTDGKNLDELKKQYPQLDDPVFKEKLKQWMDTPEGQKQIGDLLKQQGGDGVNPKDVTQDLKKMIDGQGKKTIDPKDPKIDPKVDPKTIGMNPKLDPKDPKLDPLKKIDTPPKSDNPSETGLSPEEKRKQEMVKAVEKFIGNSPAAQEAIKSFAESFAKGNFDKDLAKFFEGKDWTDASNWTKNNLKDFNPKDVPEFKGGSSSSWQFSGFGDMGGGGGSSAESSGDGGEIGGVGTVLLAIIGVLGAGFIAWLLWNRRKEALAALAKANAEKAKHTINLDGVKDRETLVQAFDYVSIEKGGEEARHWHHADAGKNLHAEPLAELYAKARYLPQSEDLSPDEYDQARTDLKDLSRGTKE